VLITDSFPSEEQISFETVEVECYDGQKMQLCLGPDITTVKAAMVILANKLEIEADALDCYFSGEYRSLQLETSVSNIIGKKIRVERRSLFRLDLIDVQRTVGIRAKWNKTIYDALDSVLSKYNLDVQNVVLSVGDCTEGRIWSSGMLEKGTRIVDFSKPVGIFDGLRIQVNNREKLDRSMKGRRSLANTSGSFSNNNNTQLSARQSCGPRSKKFTQVYTNRDVIQQKMLEQTAQSSEQCNKEKQKLLEACFADNSRIEDQRGVLCKDDFEIPNFLDF